VGPFWKFFFRGLRQVVRRGGKEQVRRCCEAIHRKTGSVALISAPEVESAPLVPEFENENLVAASFGVAVAGD